MPSPSSWWAQTVTWCSAHRGSFRSFSPIGRSLYDLRMSEVTQILEQMEPGDPKTADHLLPLVYGELRKLASAKMAQEKPGQFRFRASW